MAANSHLSVDQLPRQLLLLTSQAEQLFAAFTPDVWIASRGEGKWTPLELLGHLIDSAANNHQRFVRALAQASLTWPGYDQVAHVAVQSYRDADPAICLSLWAAYNRHLSHVLEQITVAKAVTPCIIDGAPEMSLGELALDYVAHLEHHLRQLLEGHSISYSGMPWPPIESNRQWPV